ncbi:MAG TPA: hypothetical protein VKT18_00555 [Acidimicrobiales bacterium]|nr:hypothetical protein [Acidimicrobiales bacterium]
MRDPGSTEHTELAIPAWPDFLFLVRLHVGAVASRMDMTVQEIEDLHLAVDELCLSLLGPAEPPRGRLEVSVTWDDEALDVRCRLSGNDSATAALDPIAGRILTALVDEHGLTADEGAPVAWLRKRREALRPAP